MGYFVHESAVVEPGAEVGDGTRIWHFCHVRSGARLGRGCTLGKGVYVDDGVCIGDHVKVQNNASLYDGVEIDDGVFIGPHVCFTNDLSPRAIHPDGSPRRRGDSPLVRTLVERGASLGANTAVVAGVRIGAWALVGAGSVVTRDVPAHALAYGNPARLRGVVSPSGRIVARAYAPGAYVTADGAEAFVVRASELR
jgi:acetyltransferase-like isoleucine patch superfamily enzyme